MHPIRLLPGLALLLGLGGPALGQTASTSPGATTTPTAETGGPRNLQNNEATRALDRVAGTNVSGAYPSQADGTPNNPPGTVASRALDRAAGTNHSGAYPQNEGRSPAR